MIPLLEAAYAEPHRRYHTRDHIQACLAELAGVDGLDERERRILTLTIWWHDAIYDPTRSDNEARSADLAVRALADLGEPDDVRLEVGRLIRLTAGHQVDPTDRLGALLVSIDLAILGASPADYGRYVDAIRQEYGHVPDTLFSFGRAAILRRFLEGPIFPHPAFAARFEDQARANMERELVALGA